jgi:hypothetical protein
LTNPDGSRTRDEHRAAIVERMNAYIAEGMKPDDALTKASADWQTVLKREGEEKIAEAKRLLGVEQS